MVARVSLKAQAEEQVAKMTEAFINKTIDGAVADDLALSVVLPAELQQCDINKLDGVCLCMRTYGYNVHHIDDSKLRLLGMLNDLQEHPECDCAQAVVKRLVTGSHLIDLNGVFRTACHPSPMVKGGGGP